MKVILVAAAAIMRSTPDGARVLLAQRPAGKPLAGLWEFPGGKLEPGEPPEDCLIRELKEELAIDVRVDKPITFASHPLGETKHLLMPLWRVLDFDGEPVGAEGQKLAWASADELDSFAMPPADGPLLDPVRLAMSDI